MSHVALIDHEHHSSPKWHHRWDCWHRSQQWWSIMPSIWCVWLTCWGRCCVEAKKGSNSEQSWQRKTAIAAYHVSDGINQCRFGFWQRHFVAHAKTFDGALAQATDVYYGAWSKSTVKQKKWRHNRGCCLAALISDFPPPVQYTSTATNTFLAKIAKGDEEDEAEEMSGQN